MVIICDHGVFAKVVTTKHWMTIWLTMINHQQILKYPILVYIQTHQRTWNLGKHEVEPFHGMEHNFLSSRRSRRNSKGVAQVEPTNGLKKQIAPDSDLTDLRVLTQRVQDQRTRYQGCCGLASTKEVSHTSHQRWRRLMHFDLQKMRTIMSIPKNQNSRQRYGDGSKPMGNNGIIIH